MKNILLFILLSFVFLLKSKNTEVTFQEKERVGMEALLQKDVPVGTVSSSVVELPEQGDAYVDSESLVRQFRICGRGQRSFSIQHILLNKGSAYRLVEKRLERLFHSINHIYTSLPRQSWAVSSLHYVFELRRILI